jgi:excisionase family DNA binding protein
MASSVAEDAGRLLAHPGTPGRDALPPKRGRAAMSGDGLPEILRVDDVARLLGISRGLAYEAIRRSELPAIRVGRRILVPRDRLFAHLNGVSSSFGRDLSTRRESETS